MVFHFTLSVPLASFNAAQSVACLQRVTGTQRFHVFQKRKKKSFVAKVTSFCASA
jgi:hypothetical protein